MTNPFATCFTRPGEIPFVDDLLDISFLAKQVAESNRALQIVGPHGSGKTTLTIEIARALMPRGFETTWLTIRKSSFQSQLIRNEYLSDQKIDVNKSNQKLVVVDGIESIGLAARVALIGNLSKRAKVLLTTHRKRLGATLLCRTKPSLKTFRKLCNDLCPEMSNECPSAIDAAFHAENGNYREAFFRLYDEVACPEN